jgi:2-polyprenyl-6-hydroxyphenyl methylase/3-demethylubiquinone-9 3-methyltransferase
MSTTINEQEVEKFANIANEWWDEEGSFKLLHQINPLRLAYFKEQILSHFNIEAKEQPLQNLKILDVGCGGGLISQPLAKLGAKVLAIDAAAENIAAAIKHNTHKVQYLTSTIEQLAQNSSEKYDCILAIEVLEHVEDIDMFIAAAACLLTANGMMIISTINKTMQSYLKAIIAAEYILRFVPKNTHHWEKFIKPSQLASYLRPHNLKITALKGMNYSILKQVWFLSEKIDTNYIAICKLN